MEKAAGHRGKELAAGVRVRVPPASRANGGMGGPAAGNKEGDGRLWRGGESWETDIEVALALGLAHVVE